MSLLRRPLTLAIAAVVLAVIAYVLLDHGFVRFVHPSRREYPVRGVDVSHHDGRVDWPRIRASGYVFAYLKATEGADGHASLERSYAASRGTQRLPARTRFRCSRWGGINSAKGLPLLRNMPNVGGKPPSFSVRVVSGVIPCRSSLSLSSARY